MPVVPSSLTPPVDRTYRDSSRLRQLAPILALRQQVLGIIRSFFQERGFLEVDTPVRIPGPALEDYIDAEPAADQYLRTSPELHMKRLLAAGYERIFQVGACFRRGERGRRHLPEFTMLEWYRLHADYRTLLADTLDLFGRLEQARLSGTAPGATGTTTLGGPWEELTIEEAFRKYAGSNVDEAVADGNFEQILVERVEPQLGRDRPTVLLDYPVACGGLARRKPQDPSRLERWEVYVAGTEVANACSELTDPAEQLARFEACAELRRQQGREVYALDEAFMQALRQGMPPAAGIAVGLDRLVMLLAGADTIDHVVAFPPESD